MARDESDDIQAMEAKETANRLPLGWLLLFWGLILWGVYYAWTYTPALGGWSQAKAFEESMDAAGATSGTNILATILFTAIPTTAAIWLIFTQARRKPGTR
jgi:hypothetical protein